MMKAKQCWKRLLLIPAVLLLILAGGIVVWYIGWTPVLYSGQWTYTTSDDMQTYLIRFPWIYQKPFLGIPSKEITDLAMPTATKDFWEALTDDAMRCVGENMERYNGHFNMDYSVKLSGDQIVVIYMGCGKLLDGTVETIDVHKQYPAIHFEDQTKGTWQAPLYPWDPWTKEEIESGARFRDPGELIDPPFLKERCISSLSDFS